MEVALEAKRDGMGLVESALKASHERFRPIVMTSIAFILGVVPLLTSSGAGAAARVSIGVTVFSGMIASTGLAVALVPVFFVEIEGFFARLEEKSDRKKAAKKAARLAARAAAAGTKPAASTAAKAADGANASAVIGAAPAVPAVVTPAMPAADQSAGDASDKGGDKGPSA